MGVFPVRPQHVLVNEYQPGQGIDAHRDGPLYEPRVAILSLGSHATFEFLRNDGGRACLSSLLIPARGLLVFADGAYSEHLHRVTAVSVDELGESTIRLGEASAPALRRIRRVSLTVRRVLQVRDTPSFVAAGLSAAPPDQDEHIDIPT